MASRSYTSGDRPSDRAPVTLLELQLWQEAGDELTCEIAGGGRLRRAIITERGEEDARIVQQLGVADLARA